MQKILSTSEVNKVFWKIVSTQIEIKIENNTVKSMIEKYKKTQQNLHLKVEFFQVQYKTTSKNFLLQLLVC